MVHQRFSTNTFPTWPLAHPFRYICHNGEINTVRGNANWMAARQAVMASGVWGDDLKKILPIVEPGGSDSATLDNAVELLYLSGRSIPHVMSMLIPEAWDADTTMQAEKKAYYEFHASIMEPWTARPLWPSPWSRPRRHARSQRPPPLPLLSNEGWPVNRRLRDRRAARQARRCDLQRAPAAR